MTVKKIMGFGSANVFQIFEAGKVYMMTLPKGASKEDIELAAIEKIASMQDKEEYEV